MSQGPKEQPQRQPGRHRLLKEMAVVAALGPAIGGLAGAVNPVYWHDDKAWVQTEAEAIMDGAMLGTFAAVPAGGMILLDRGTRRLEAKRNNDNNVTQGAGPPGRPIKIAVELTREAAEAHRLAPMLDDLRRIVAQLGIDLVPAFPDASEPSLICKFIVESPDRLSAEEVIRELYKSAAISSAHLTQESKLDAEVDKEQSHVDRLEGSQKAISSEPRRG